jgi:hypothetical protein
VAAGLSSSSAARGDGGGGDGGGGGGWLASALLCIAALALPVFTARAALKAAGGSEECAPLAAAPQASKELNY